MKIRLIITFLLLFSIFTQSGLTIFAQSRPQRPDTSKGNQKKNQRPTEEELKKIEEEKKRQEEEKKAACGNYLLKFPKTAVFTS